MTARQDLWDIAIDQYGFVTADDARDLEIAPMTMQMLVRRGQLRRVSHGVYRFPVIPATEFDNYMAAVLWTGVPEACLSHETALALYDVSDINPTKVHITLPRERRIRRSGGETYKLHYEDLTADEIGWLHQIRATKFTTTIRQCIDGGVPTYLLRQALETGARRGLLLPRQRSTLKAKMEDRDADE